MSKVLQTSCRRFFIILIVVGLLLVPALTAQTTSVPRLIRYRGQLSLASRSTTQSVTGITFAVYMEEQGGSPLWSEVQLVQVAQDGQFEVLLGSASGEGLPSELFQGSEGRWLSVKPDGVDERPRILLVSVPFALKAGDADTLAGRPASAYMLQPVSADNNNKAAVTSSHEAQNANPVASGTVGAGTPNYLAKFIDAATVATSNVVETALGLGVDVSVPTQKLDVAGRLKIRARDGSTSGIWFTGSNGNQELFVGQTDLDSMSPFGIWHAGRWRLVFTNAGNLGVGVGTAPVAPLDVGGRAMLRATDQETAGVLLTDKVGNQQLFLGLRGLESSSPFGIWHGGDWRLTLTNEGNLGLGTDPFVRLDVAGRAMMRASDQGSAGMWLAAADGTADLFLGQVGVRSDDPFGIWHNGAWRFWMDKYGQVGIGGPPQFPLDVIGRMRLRSLYGQPAGAWISGDSEAPQLFVGQTYAAGAAPFGVFHGGDWRLVVLPGGNVGMGTTVPTERLEVAGNVKLGSGGRLIFPDGTSLGTAAGSNAPKPKDSSIDISSSSGNVQIAVASAGVGTDKLADGSVTSSKIADGAVTLSKLSIGAIPPTAIAGTAATLGANSFQGLQTLQGALTVTGLSQLSTTLISGNGPDTIALDVSNNATTGSANAVRATTYSVNGSAVYAVASPPSGNASALFGRSDAPQGTGVYGEGSASSSSNIGVHGIARGGTGIGLEGEAFATSGPNFGVIGRASGDNASAGVLAEATATSTMLNTYGLLARAYSKNGIGVYGYALSMTGNTYGVYGRVDSPNGIAGMFMTSASSGNVLVANNAVRRIMRLDASGNLYAAGTLNPNGADYAEMVAAAGDRKGYEPGDVLVIDEDEDRHVSLSNAPYATNIAGVFSTKPGVIGSQHEMGADPEDEIPVAMVGIVPCKVTIENGPIRRGDLLVTSSVPGYAMRGTDRTKLTGAILGRAMQPLVSGSGIIEIMVSPQ